MDARPKGMALWLRVLLGVSLALNLLVIGAVAGSFAKWGGPHGNPMARIEQIGGPLTQALSPQERIMVMREMRRKLREMGGGREEKIKVFQAFISDVRAEPFDRETVAGHLATHRRMITERIAIGQGILLDRLAQMSAEERAEFTQRMEESLRRDGMLR